MAEKPTAMIIIGIIACLAMLAIPDEAAAIGTGAITAIGSMVGSMIGTANTAAKTKK